MGYSSAVSVHLDRGQISAEGLVATNLELRDLRNTLMETYSGIHFQVRSGERICEAIEEILGEMETKLRVVNLQPGVYSVVGYVSNVDKWQKILPRIATDVPGVKKFQNDVTTPEKVITTSQALLNQYGFGRSVAVIPEAGRILYQGKISVLQAEQWKKAVEDLIQAFGDLVAMEFDVQTHSAQTETTNTGFFPQPIQSITISSSGLSWIVTSDGKKYFIGSFLPSGWRVDAIAIDGLSLSRDGKQVTMHLEALK
jgi:type III secretion system YscD/HrpQ family protein